MPAIAMDIAKPTICGSGGLAKHNFRGCPVGSGAAKVTVFEDEGLMEQWAKLREEWARQEPKSVDEWEVMDGRRSRIDPERSKYNYALKAPAEASYEKEARRVLEKAKAEGRVRYRIVANDRIPSGEERGKNAKGKKGQNGRATVFLSQIATLPEGMPLELAPAYFRAVYDFWAKEVGGEEFILSAHVHLDETTPHLHVCALPMVPCLTQDGKEHLKLSSKDFWNERGGRDSYSAVHDKIYLHLTGAGFDVERGVVGGKRKYYKMSELREGAREVDELREKLDKAKGELNTEQGKLAEAAEQAKAKAVELEDAVKSGQDKLKEVQGQVEAGERELARLESDLDSRRGELKKVSDKVDAKQKELKDAVKSGQEKLTGVQGQVEAKERELAKLDSDLVSKHGELEQMQEKLSNLQNQIEAKVKEIAGLEPALAIERGKVVAAKGDLKKAEGEAKARKEELAKLDSDLDSKRVELKAAEDKLGKALRDVAEQVEKLGALGRELNSKREELQKTQGELKDVSDQVDVKQKELEMLEPAFESGRKKLEELKKKITEEDKGYVEAANAHGERRKDLKEVTAQLGEAQNELRTAKAELANLEPLREEHARLGAEVAGFQSLVAEFNAKYVAHAAQNPAPALSIGRQSAWSSLDWVVPHNERPVLNEALAALSEKRASGGFMSTLYGEFQKLKAEHTAWEGRLKLREDDVARREGAVTKREKTVKQDARKVKIDEHYTKFIDHAEHAFSAADAATYSGFADGARKELCENGYGYALGALKKTGMKEEKLEEVRRIALSQASKVPDPKLGKKKGKEIG